MSERIFLTYTNASALPFQGTVLGHHVVLNYVDANGNHHTLQGMPEHKFDRNAAKFRAFLEEEVFSDGEKNTDSPFQRLWAHQLSGKGADFALRQPHTMIADGDDLSPLWARMTKFGDDVNSTGYEYRPYSQNSNSFAAGALRRAGLLGMGTVLPEVFDRLIAVDPVSGEAHAVRIPGFDQRLANPLTKTLGDSAASSLPTVNDQREGEKKRYLARRVVGRSDASIFDVGAPSVPVGPSEGTDLSGGPTSMNNRFSNWTTSPLASAPLSPYRTLPPTQNGRPLGIVNGEPKPDYLFPPPILDYVLRRGDMR